MSPSFRRRAHHLSLLERSSGELPLKASSDELLTIGEECERKGSFAITKAVAPDMILELAAEILLNTGRSSEGNIPTFLLAFWSSTNLRYLNSPIVRALTTERLPVIGESSPNSPRVIKSWKALQKIFTVNSRHDVPRHRDQLESSGYHLRLRLALSLTHHLSR